MIVYPAIDIKNGKCVRLAQGEFEKVTVYLESPVEMARKFEKSGAKYLHVVDLDGARTGIPQNSPTIREMAAGIGIPIQLGGGIRSVDTVKSILGNGISRVILGTSAVKDEELLKRAINSFGDNLAIAVDARDGLVATNGWVNTSEFAAVEFAKRVESLGAATIIYTDISRDGMLGGPNLKAMEEMVRSVDIEVIASGGVTSLQDVVDLKNAGLSGVIIGKALYSGDIDLGEALEAAKQLA